MKRYATLVSVMLLSQGVPALAAISDEEFSQLRAQFAALADRLDRVEAENQQLRDAGAQTLQEVQVANEQIAMVQKAEQSSSWADTIGLKGDFRYRYENIDEEDSSGRDRNRIRARVALTAQLPEDVKIGFGVASGGEDPVSTNQTLGGGSSSKELRLDLAYFNWGALDGLRVIGGKFKNPWYRPQKSGLMWDSDFNPEGLAVTYKRGAFFGSGVANFLESDTRKDNDEVAWGVQAGFKTAVGAAKLTAGVGYFELETAGKRTFFGDDDDFFGNSFICLNEDNPATCVYRYDYEMVEVFAELSFNIGDMPLTLFGDYVQNQDADDFDTGWVAGIKLGSTKASGDWQASYAYQDLEADAVFGLVTDSDFGGGGTDGSGHVIKGGYAMNKKWSIGFSYLINEIDKDSGDKHDYDRLMIDTKFKY